MLVGQSLSETPLERFSRDQAPSSERNNVELYCLSVCLSVCVSLSLSLFSLQLVRFRFRLFFPSRSQISISKSRLRRRLRRRHRQRRPWRRWRRRLTSLTQDETLPTCLSRQRTMREGKIRIRFGTYTRLRGEDEMQDGMLKEQ